MPDMANPATTITPASSISLRYERFLSSGAMALP
jgi:hypothetical protein